MTHEQHLYGDQWHAITDSPAAKRRAKSQRPRGSYFEEGTHGQDMERPRKGGEWNTQSKPVAQYRPKEDTGFAPETSPEERGLLTEAEGPDDFDAAVLKHGDLELVAEEMRDTMPQWVLEERLLGEINKRTTLVGDEFKKRGWWKGSPLPDDRVVGPNEGRGVAPGVILDDVVKSGDHLAITNRGNEGRQVQDTLGSVVVGPTDLSPEEIALQPMVWKPEAPGRSRRRTRAYKDPLVRLDEAEIRVRKRKAAYRANIEKRRAWQNDYDQRNKAAGIERPKRTGPWTLTPKQRDRKNELARLRYAKKKQQKEETT